jgi:hypothetical protein
MVPENQRQEQHGIEPGQVLEEGRRTVPFRCHSRSRTDGAELQGYFRL